MTRFWWQQPKQWSLAVFVVLIVLWFGPALSSQDLRVVPKPVILSAQMQKNGTLVYRVNGKRVEDSKSNSFLTNLGEIVKKRGTKIPAFVIIDVRAPFSEMGKLETALDKEDLTYERRLFVSSFRDGTMNEIHWDDTSIPIPRN